MCFLFENKKPIRCKKCLVGSTCGVIFAGIKIIQSVREWKIPGVEQIKIEQMGQQTSVEIYSERVSQRVGLEASLKP
jgi:hypothetical protein